MTQAAPTLNPGDYVDGFQIEQCLSASETSAVYLALDTQLDQRFVLKECLPAGLCMRNTSGDLEPVAGAEGKAASAIEAFRAAARLQADLDHPAIPGVLRMFAARGTDWMVMPWRPGETLEQAIARNGPMAPDALRTLLKSVAAALAFLHRRAVLHLALEPANVLLCDHDRVLLLDYRCAAVHQRGLPLAEEITPWRAPELCNPEAAPTAAADLYGLCALALFCLTGTAPATASQRQDAVAGGQPDPLATPAPTAEAGGLGDAIELGLRIDPARRPPDIDRWRQELESIEWRRTIARSATPTERERPEWLSPLLLGALLAIVTMAAAWLLLIRAPAQPPGQTEALPAAERAAPIPEAETRQWQAALQADTLAAYRQFLERFPDTTYRPQAQVQLDILDERAWAELSAEDTLSAYQHYLAQFPEGLNQVEALRRIDRIEQALSAEERARIERERQDEQAWRTARETGTITALDVYLEAWPAGQHADEATALRSAIKSRELEARAWAAAVQLNTPDAYRTYLDAYPDGEHSAEALITLEHLDLGPGKRFRDCADCPAMVVVPAGVFQQGASDGDPLAGGNERPQRAVDIGRSFAIGVHEVTFAEWDACVSAGGCDHRPADNGWGRGSRPVIMVSWNDAQQYVNWLSETTRQSYRLPSESEWEYAARAGETTAWPGGESGAVCRHANVAAAETGFEWRLQACNDGNPLGTLPAGALDANAFGLHDVIGNVAEWTSDCLNISYLDAPVDGSAWTRGICSSHMTRGGSWVTGARESRLSARFSLDAGDRNDFTGFRVVRTIED